MVSLNLSMQYKHTEYCSLLANIIKAAGALIFENLSVVLLLFQHKYEHLLYLMFLSHHLTTFVLLLQHEVSLNFKSSVCHDMIKSL